MGVSTSTAGTAWSVRNLRALGWSGCVCLECSPMASWGLLRALPLWVVQMLVGQLRRRPCRNTLWYQYSRFLRTHERLCLLVVGVVQMLVGQSRGRPCRNTLWYEYSPLHQHS